MDFKNDTFITLALSSPVLMAVLVWFLKNTILRTLRDTDDKIKLALTQSTQTMASVTEISTRLAVWAERSDQQINGLNKNVGALEARQDKITERLDKALDFWRNRIEALEAKNDKPDS